MSQGRFGIRAAAGIKYYGPWTMPDDPHTSANESLYTHSEWTEASAAGIPILYFGMRTSSNKFLYANRSGGSGTQQGYMTSVNSPEQVFSLVDLNRGCLESGDYIGIKTGKGFWLNLSRSTVRADAVTPHWNTLFRIIKVNHAPGHRSNRIDHDSQFMLETLDGRFLRSTSARTYVTTTPGRQGIFTMRRTFIDSLRKQQFLVHKAKSLGIDFGGQFDRDRDGRIEPHELSIMPVVAASLTGNGGGYYRTVTGIKVPGESTSVDCNTVIIREDTNLATITHELMHTIDSKITDIYFMSQGVSLMSATINEIQDYRLHADAWVKMRLGWIRPKVLNLVGLNSMELIQAYASPGSPRGQEALILYDPSRYNLATRSGEFFMLEMRYARRYDQHVADNGMVIWRVETDSTGALITLPRIASKQRSCIHQSADGRLHGSKLWDSSQRIITPRYLDGTPAPIRLRVNSAPGKPQWGWVELSRTGQLQHSITSTSFGNSLSRGSPCSIVGSLATHQDANTWIWLAGRFRRPTSFGWWTGHGSALSFDVPRDTPTGEQRLYVFQYGRWSRPHTVHVR